MDHFADLFVFNGLTPFLFRMESRPPSRPQETGGLAFAASSEKQ
jgi:hypothetical protein